MRRGFWFMLSLLVIAGDQLTKYLAVSALLPYQPVPVMPMLNWTLAYNTGAAFSFLNGAGGWQHWFFLGFSSVMSVILAVWLLRLPRQDKLMACSLSLILGGAVGNLIDRLHYGYVIDFIDMYYKHYHWPIFNIADSAICIGAVLLLIESLKKGKR
ncbi:MAG: lipoprotein signal peptidase [Legionellaceae bacterium]|nr:lipoprotein signal peptidase [Legionellaceae bacterium]